MFPVVFIVFWKEIAFAFAELWTGVDTRMSFPCCTDSWDAPANHLGQFYGHVVPSYHPAAYYHKYWCCASKQLLILSNSVPISIHVCSQNFLPDLDWKRLGWFQWNLAKRTVLGLSSARPWFCSVHLYPTSLSGETRRRRLAVGGHALVSGCQNIELSNHKLKFVLKYTVWSQCKPVQTDRHTDYRQTEKGSNIMAIARRFVLTNASGAKTNETR